ncbi:flagellar motor switch protein FliM [Desulfotomaculum arcticum]|uniref:Flagellar motor switch protein FliM n=1 Tax=Desulfotruncus arcticus DSM 17038 TaxID=1121424 RepID=A0A1I2N3Q4_9FIRM|nr:flagellar motor switch protein FliM [Desulfotruncus arcticus]SFF96347.1 flagellar motor switch protein FliM [Desulfotomaculum arcticum] [Desulfotruncus arcticus DSM 17038]
MQEVLSQSEIDSLLQALNTGNIPVQELQHAEDTTTRLKSYDFRRPNKFSKEHLRTLEMLHQHYARHLSSFLSGYLSTNINIELASVGQIIFDEFIRSIPTPTILTIFELKPLNGPAIFEANTNFIFPVIDLMFGGNGTVTDLNRELTDIEIQVTKKIMNRILEYLVPTWKDIVEIKPEVRTIETNPRLQQLYSPNEVVALLTFTITLGENDQGMMNLCLPYMVLDEVVSMLSVRQQFVRQFSSATKDDYDKLLHWLGYSAIEITAVIGEAEIQVEDFLQIQVGDVVVLDRNVNNDLDVYIGDKLKFGAQVGSVGDKLAIQVVSLFEGEGTDDR